MELPNDPSTKPSQAGITVSSVKSLDSTAEILPQEAVLLQEIEQVLEEAEVTYSPCDQAENEFITIEDYNPDQDR